MPDHRDGDVRQRDRCRADGQAHAVGEEAREPGVHRGDDGGLPHHEGHHREPRRGQRDDALAADLGQRVIHHAVGALDQAREQVREAHVVVERDRRRDPDQLGVEDAEVALLVEDAALVVRLALLEHADSEIDPSRIEVVEDAVPIDRVQQELHPRCHRLQMRDEGRHQKHLGRVRDAEGEGEVGRGRIEGSRRRRDLLNLGQCRLHRPKERQRARRWPHAVGPPRQQLIREGGAQPRQGMAHRRLADADPSGRAGHAPLRQQRVEGDEQVEIEPG